MQNSIKDVLITNDPFSYWAGRVKDNIDERTPVSSTDILTTTTTRGTKFNIHPKYKLNPNYLKYVGDWNISASYDVNDVVSVFEGSDKTPTTLLEEQLDSFFKNGWSIVPSSIDPAIMEYQGSYTAPEGQVFNVNI